MPGIHEAAMPKIYTTPSVSKSVPLSMRASFISSLTKSIAAPSAYYHTPSFLFGLEVDLCCSKASFNVLSPKPIESLLLMCRNNPSLIGVTAVKNLSPSL